MSSATRIADSPMFPTAEWLDGHLESALRRAGPRYTASPNITVDVSRVFNGLGRTPELLAPLQEAQQRLLRCGSSLRSEYGGKLPELPAIVALLVELDELLRSVSLAQPVVPFELLKELSTKTSESAELASFRLRNEEESTSRHWLQETVVAADGLTDLCERPEAVLANRPCLLLTGEAGTGKTHLMCDVAIRRARQGLMTLLLFGDQFGSRDVWSPILECVGGPDMTKEGLLADLDRLGKSCDGRSLILVDAINEGAAGSKWRGFVEQLVGDVAPYPNVGVGFSIRAGFELAVLGGEPSAGLVTVEHRGFPADDWEAVDAFFRHYRVGMPDIPLVDQEFRNPLFLKIFCQAFEGSRRSYRGGEGATHIYEQYVKRLDKKLAKEVGFPKGRGVLWRLVSKRMAEWMGLQSSSQMPSRAAVRIADAAAPGRGRALLRAMELHGLLTRLPRLNRHGRVHSYLYRFPYQKFSDHLIVRYLLNAHQDTAGLKRAFATNRKLGMLLRNPWMYGLMEALAVQIPERYKCELPDLITAGGVNTTALSEAFIQSLIWRKPEATNDGTFSFINTVIATNRYLFKDLLEALVSVSVVPNHGLNARGLDRFLKSLPMPDRDSVWLEYLHSTYDGGSAVDRLIRWAHTSYVATVTEEALQLYGIALAWCLAAANRFVRDRATKALVAAYSRRPRDLPVLLEVFVEADDPYVAERLLAVAYGVALRCEDHEAIGSLAQFAYDFVFASDKPSTHILLRDYARQLVEISIARTGLPEVDPSVVRPPYGSAWPARIPSRERLAAKYKGDRDYWPLWESVMEDGDFARYIIGTNHADFPWSGRRIAAGTQASSEALRSQTRLGRKQFDLEILQRWIFSRVLKLGWTPDRFASFDSTIGTGGRSAHKAERIGKKYQWIAYHELLGLVADNFEWDVRWDDSSTVYDGPWSPHVRDIDPSCLLTGVDGRTRGDGWYARPEYAGLQSGLNDDDWTSLDAGLPDPISMIRTDSNGVSWYTIDAHHLWRQDSLDAQTGDGSRTRTLWCIIKCYAAHQEDLDALYAWALTQDYRGRWMPETRAFHEVFLREYPSAAPYRYVCADGSNREGWTRGWRHSTMPADVLLMADGYLGEASTQDCSNEDGINLTLPSAWLVEGMGLKHGDTDGEFARDQELATLNPRGEDWHVLLARAEELTDFLTREGLGLFWILEGEKMIVGSDYSDEPRPHQYISGAFRLVGDLVEGALRASK